MTLSRRSFFATTAGLTASLGLLGSASFAAGPLKVGVLIPGSTSDKGWMESGYDGLMAAQGAHGDQIEVQLIENINYADMEQVITGLAAGNELVIGVGGQTQTAIQKVSRRFPDVKFSVVGGARDEAGPNVALYDVRTAEIAFVAGAAAAMLSETGVVSYIGGMEIPAIVNAGTEFGNGARFVNPDIKYVSTFTGDFDDVSKAKEATMAAIGQGADIHYHILNLGLRGLEQAAREKGTHIIGSYSDRCGTDPLYIAYSVTGVGYQVRYAIEKALSGKWEPGYLPFGLAMGDEASDFTFCAASEEMRARIAEIKDDLRSGKITTLEG